MERNIEYSFRLYSKNVRKGDDCNHYTQVIQININNFAFDENTTTDLYCFQNKEGMLLSEKIMILQIYVPNLRKKWYTKGVKSLTEEERFLLTLIEPSIKDSLELGKGNPLMEEYIKEAIESSEDIILQEAYDKEWALKDEGVRDGMEKGILLVAKNLLKKEVDIEIIMETTGLTKEKILEIMYEK